jgi:DNA topoisomerase IB
MRTRWPARIRSLVIPPAWEDVWICPDPWGHVQAIGTDSAGRRQYRYHDLWRELRDQAKHDRVREFGAALPRICGHLEGRGLTRDRVLAAAIRLIDLGFFRPGGEEYAEENGTFGLATILKQHVTLSHNQLVFEYAAKGAKHREQAVAEDQVCAVVRSLRRRRGGGDQLLVYRSGPGWHGVTAANINDYLHEVSGGDYTAKDFRTWHATVLAAVGLAMSEGAADRDAARKRAIARVVREVADYLGNTPAVARASYIDPRVIELYEGGFTIASALADLGKDCDFGDLATRGRRIRGRETPGTARPARRLARAGVARARVNSVAPGPVWTPLIPATFDKERSVRSAVGCPWGEPPTRTKSPRPMSSSPAGSCPVTTRARYSRRSAGRPCPADPPWFSACRCRSRWPPCG